MNITGENKKIVPIVMTAIIVLSISSGILLATGDVTNTDNAKTIPEVTVSKEEIPIEDYNYDVTSPGCDFRWYGDGVWSEKTEYKPTEDFIDYSQFANYGPDGSDYTVYFKLYDPDGNLAWEDQSDDSLDAGYYTVWTVTRTPPSGGWKTGDYQFCSYVEPADCADLTEKCCYNKVGGEGPCAIETAAYETPLPEDTIDALILNPLRELRDGNLKEEYVNRYYDYSPDLTMVMTKDPALRHQAARLLLKYSPMVWYHVYGIGVDKQITRRDVKEIVSFTDRLKRGVWKNRDEIGTERSEEIIKFLDEFKEQVEASEGKTFSEALQGSIYCKDEQMPVGDLQHQTGQL